jgi:hypothetical protein
VRQLGTPQRRARFARADGATIGVLDGSGCGGGPGMSSNGIFSAARASAFGERSAARCTGITARRGWLDHRPS